MVKIDKVALEMANKYKESNLKWVLILKRLEMSGYEVIKKQKRDGNEQ